MKKKISIPFRNMTSKGWLNIALAVIFTIYIIQIGFAIINNSICMEIGIDFCAFWSAGKIINNYRFADIYNMDVLTKIQKDLYPHGNTTHFEPFGILYLPIFLIPFKYLSLINPLSSYLIWTIINSIGVILYLRFFTKKLIGHILSYKLLFMIMLSFPFFGNLKDGQVNIWLVICTAEFIRAFLTFKPYKAGFWLGGLLLKPQLLILLLPFLLVERELKVIIGFMGSTTIALLLSFALIGGDGFLNFINIILQSAKGGVESNPYYMINWRMLGSYFEIISNPTVGWTIVILGTIATLFGTLFLLRQRLKSTPIKQAIKLLGIFSATCAITWHAHLHNAVFLIPVLLYLVMLEIFNYKLLLKWFLIPILAYFTSYFFAIIIKLLNVSINTSLVMGFAKGFPGLIVNIIIQVWAIRQLAPKEGEPLQDFSL